MRQSKKKQLLEEEFDRHYHAGLVLHRSEDFHERIETFVTNRLKMEEISERINAQLPAGFPRTFLIDGNATIYAVTPTWKAAIELAWMNESIGYYRFWFAQPAKRPDFGTQLEMNMLATAIEKAFLSIANNTLVIISYASAFERNFEIGPQSAASKLPDIGALFGNSSIVDIALDFAQTSAISSMKGLSKETSIRVFSEYLAERKSEKRLGGDVAQDLLALRFLDTPACPPAISARLEELRLHQRTKNYCRRCGAALRDGVRFCEECGVAII